MLMNNACRITMSEMKVTKDWLQHWGLPYIMVRKPLSDEVILALTYSPLNGRERATCVN